MKSTCRTLILVFALLVPSLFAQGGQSGINIEELARLRNTCQFKDLLASLEDLHSANPQSFAYAEMLIAYTLKAGDFQRALSILEDAVVRFSDQEGFDDLREDFKLLFAFYQRRDFKTVSQTPKERGFSPSGLEAVMLASIMTDNRERLEACQRFQKEPYHCLLARKRAGSYARLNTRYRGKIPSLILEYLNGEIDRKELDASLASCLADLPTYGEILSQVLDTLEKKPAP